ncbi:unnamed protein product [Peniophora sp. CBMAI 1063]|nr:unnamed protein product [Peniophora sp. CBMAI 1063]
MPLVRTSDETANVFPQGVTHQVLYAMSEVETHWITTGINALSVLPYGSHWESFILVSTMKVAMTANITMKLTKK